jgi:hypothetical protein
VAHWKRGVGRPPVPATVRERMRALIAADPEAPPLEVLRRLREEGADFSADRHGPVSATWHAGYAGSDDGLADLEPHQNGSSAFSVR